MRKQLFFIFFLLTCYSLQATAQNYNDKQNMAVVTDQEPFYPKGDAELYKLVMNSVKYSDEAKQKYIEGTVTLSFDVSADSTIGNTQIISGLCCGINEEVQRVVKSIKFAPAVQNGVKMRMNIMMDFPIKAH